MSKTPSILVTICARGGSKGIPGKNIREVNGKPLIAYTIECVKKWDQYTDLIVSTDSEEIAEVAREYGAQVPFMRPSELASDDAAKLPAVQHATDSMEEEKNHTYDYVVDLSATAPLRTVEDIKNCFDAVYNTDATNAYTVCEAEKNPYFNMVECDENGYASLVKSPPEKVVRRQDAPVVYEMNASVYVFERGFLATTNTIHGEQTRIAEMPPERSADIDRPINLARVEFLIDSEEVKYD